MNKDLITNIDLGLTSTIGIELTWIKTDQYEPIQWESNGAYGATISTDRGGKFVATLFAPISATRWEPEDVTEIAERVFDEFLLAREWVFAKEVERAAQELLAEVDIEEANRFQASFQ
jgi:hypothetical protein